jgi:L-iditol 2-dehydrogenase
LGIWDFEFEQAADENRIQEVRHLPPPNADEVTVAVQSTSICGSDLHYYSHYRNGDIIVREPMTLGHESAGIVTALGSGISHLKIGDKVALEVGEPCGECALCKEGRYNICKGLRFRSSAKSFPHFQGTLQERINQRGSMCYKFVPHIYYTAPSSSSPAAKELFLLDKQVKLELIL